MAKPSRWYPAPEGPSARATGQAQRASGSPQPPPVGRGESARSRTITPAPEQPSAQQILTAAAAALTPKEYDAFWYHDCAGLSQRAAAAALGITRSALRSRLEAARRKIASELQAMLAADAATRKAPP